MDPLSRSLSIALEEQRMVETLLGTALRRPDFMDELIAFGYGVDDIDNDTHRKIWKLATEMRRAKMTPDPVIIEARLVAAGVDEVDAAAFVGGCMRSTIEVDPLRLRSFVEQLRQRVALRRIGAVAKNMLASLGKAGATATAISAASIAEMKRIMSNSSACNGATGKEIADIAGKIIRGEMDDMVHHPTHIPGIDRLLNGGVPEGTIFLLGAHSGVGKSTYARFMAIETALRGTPCLYLSTEMKRKLSTPPLIAQLCGVNIKAKMTPAQATRAEEARAVFDSLPIHFVDQTGMTVEDVTTKVHRYVDEHGVRVVYQDYVQAIVKSDVRGSRDDAPHIHISERLRECVEETNVAMTQMCQLRQRDSRSTVKNAEDMPADSGQYYKDASQYATIYRDKNNPDPNVANESRIDLLKNRYFGELGSGYLQYADNRLQPKENTRAPAAKSARRTTATPPPEDDEWMGR